MTNGKDAKSEPSFSEKPENSDTINEKCDKIDNSKSTTTSATALATTSESSENQNSNSNNVKKRVTFRSTLETSDDYHVVKKVYNPNFDGPIVSIIKKESLKRPILVYKKSNIVRPSRLTEIVKSVHNNIDKLNSLKFGREYHNNLFLNDNDNNSSSSIIADSKFTNSTINSKIIKPGKKFHFNGEDSESDGKRLLKKSSWIRHSSDDDSQTARENKRFGK